MNKLLVLTRNLAEYERILHAMALPELEIYLPRTEKEIIDLLPHVNIFLANPPIAKKYVNQAPKLVWMQSTFAGIDSMIAADLRSDYVITNVKDTYGGAMAEYVFAYILLFEREVLENIRGQRRSPELR